MPDPQVHLHELVSAFHNGGAATFYLDRETGQVVMDYEGTMYDDEGADIHSVLLQSPSRFLEIDRIGSRETLRMMQDFIAQEKSQEARVALQQALNSQRPFQSFRDTLYNFPPTRKRWYAYEERRVQEMAQKWLTEHAVNAKLFTPGKPRRKKEEAV